MEKISKTFLLLVYPFLISLFLFCFVNAFVKKYCEVLEIFTTILMIFFITLFLIGLTLNIVWNIRSSKKD